MGDYSYLVGWDEESGTGVAPQLESKLYVPLFWFGMFDPEDVKSVSLDGDAFVKPPNATAAFEDDAYAYVDGATALKRLKERMVWLGSATNAALGKKFLAFAKVFAERGLLLKLGALADGRAAWVQKFRESLKLVADPATPVQALRNLGDLGDGWESKPFAENMLIGWGTQLTAREREQAKQKKVSPKQRSAERVRTERWRTDVDQIAPEARLPYLASSSFSAGDVIEHAKFGPGVVQRIVEKTKIEVQFESTLTVLVHKPA
ncbi:MAG TPA: hypothetical protein VGM90_12740 [Kofleriaceae bacterium]